MISHGAITVVNAIPCGIGATVGADLVTRAEFRDVGPGRTVRIINDMDEDTSMARICVRRTFEHHRTEEPEGWSLSVDSQIPVSRGLKSSSSACNAIIATVSEHISKEHGVQSIGEMDAIRLGVRCAREANVTVTGSFDDACGCQLGGLVITDNRKDEVIMRRGVEENDIILLVPEARIRKPSLDRESFHAVADASMKAVKRAESDWHGALTDNGRIIAKVLGIDDTVSERAMGMGALAAGVSGTGPAISVVVGKGEGASFIKDLEHTGFDTMITRTR